MDDELACSARGKCIDTDTCVCNVNYFGDRCQITICYGTRSNDSTVCSAIGQCIAYDACQCPTGYTGEKCETEIFGSLRSLGKNTNGQIGDDYLIQRSNMTKVYYPLGDGTLVSKIVAGDSIAITTSGELYSWGQGAFYRLGHQALTDRLIPTPILSGQQVVNVCSGSYHSVAVTSEGKIFSWGTNTYDGTNDDTDKISGQLGVASITVSIAPHLLNPINGTPIEVSCGAVGNGLHQYEKVPVRIHRHTKVREFTRKNGPAFFYYFDTRLLTFYDSFDQDTVLEVFEPVLSSADNTLIEWREFDEQLGRSIAKMTSYLSTLKPRSMILCKSALINQVDQQLQLEFVSDLDSVANVELLYVSQKDQSYYVYSSVRLDSDGTYSLSISYQLGESMVEQMTKVIKCPDYALGTVHTLEMKLVRPEIEMMNHNITRFNEWISVQNISTNISNPVPDEPWRIDAVLKKEYSFVCSLSFATDESEVELFKQMLLSEGLLAISQSLPLHVQQTPSSPVLNIDRVWISCQYGATYGCNVTQVPKKNSSVNTTTSEAMVNVQQYGKTVVAAVFTVAAYSCSCSFSCSFPSFSSLVGGSGSRGESERKSKQSWTRGSSNL